MRKKIVIVTNGTLPVPAVSGGAAENLTQMLIDYNELYKDFHFVVFTVGQKLIQKQIKNYKHTDFVLINEQSKAYKLNKVLKFFKNKALNQRYPNQFLSSVLKQKDILEEADLILVSNNPYFGAHLKSRVGNKVILHLHNDYVNKESAESFQLKTEAFKQIICVSEFIEKRVQESTYKGQVKCVYNGINLDRFILDNDIDFQRRIKEQYQITDKDFVFVFSGRVQKSKGILPLVQAFLKLLNNGKQIKLLIIGGSAYANSRDDGFIDSLKEVIGEDALNHVIFTGFINYNEIHHYYKVGHVAVLPSLETEAFGLTSIEAQASGLPVIVTDSGGMPETVSETTGFVVNRNKNISEQIYYYMNVLLTDEKLRNKMSISAVNYSNNFSELKYYNNMVEKLNDQ